MKNLKSITMLVMRTIAVASLQTITFAAEPSVIVSTNKPSYKVGESATFTVIGGPGSTPIYWTSWTHDPATNKLVPTNETNAFIGTTDAFGNWSGSLSAWTGSQIGVRKRQAVIGNRKGFITFAVTPNLSTDKSVYSVAGDVGDRILFTITGAPPSSQIRWNTWLNGVQVATSAYYGQNTDSGGNWSAISDPYLPSFVGFWKQEAVIGNHRASVEYTVAAKLAVDKAVYQAGSGVAFTITGAPPNSPIFWDSWQNGRQVVFGSFYGQYTDSNGNWSAQSNPYLPAYVGLWRQRASIAGQQFDVSYNIMPAPLNDYSKRLGVEMFYEYATYEDDVKLFENIYGRAIRLRFYETCITPAGQSQRATTLTERAQQASMRTVFSNPNIHTYHLTATDAAISRLCTTAELPFYVNPPLVDEAKKSQVTEEYKNLTLHLYQQYSGTGKRFYLGNWEGDNILYCGEAFRYVTDESFRALCNSLYQNRQFGPSVASPQDMAFGLKKWFESAMKGVFEGRSLAAQNGWFGVEVYYAPGFNSVQLLQNPSVAVPGSNLPPLYSLLNGSTSTGFGMLSNLSPGEIIIDDIQGQAPRVEQVPRFDFVSYSAYDTINRLTSTNNVLYDDFEDKIVPKLGSGNILIGEFGFSYRDYQDPNEVDVKATRVIDLARSWRSQSQVVGIPHMFWWQLRDDCGAGGYCDPGTQSEFGLYKYSSGMLKPTIPPTGLQPIGMSFNNKLKP